MNFSFTNSSTDIVSKYVCIATDLDVVKNYIVKRMFDACENDYFLFSFFFYSQFLFDA